MMLNKLGSIQNIYVGEIDCIHRVIGHRLIDMVKNFLTSLQFYPSSFVERKMVICT